MVLWLNSKKLNLNRSDMYSITERYIIIFISTCKEPQICYHNIDQGCVDYIPRNYAQVNDLSELKSTLVKTINDRSLLHIREGNLDSL